MREWLLLVLIAAGCQPGLAEGDRESRQVQPATGERSHSAAPGDREPAIPIRPLDWPGWRGWNARAIADSGNLPDAWPREKLKAVWDEPLGAGWSSPVIAARRVFVTDRVGNQERLSAFSYDTGFRLWQVTNSVSFEPHAVGRRHGNGPKSTPAVDDSRVFSLGIAGWLQCVDATTGRLIWKHNLPAEFSEQQPLAGNEAVVNGTENVLVPTAPGQAGAVPLFGYTGSPLLTDGKLILSVGGERGGTIMAFHPETGDVLWKSLHEHVSYSSPVPAELCGVRQVVVMTGPRVVGLRLSDGELLWSHPFQIQYDESISTPAIGDDLVLVTGDSRPLTALRITGDDAKLTCQVAWENTDLSSYLSSMVVSSGHVYGMADDGQLACLQLADGKTVWQGGDHGYYCSPVVCGQRLVCLNEAGSLLVAAAAPSEFKELGRSQLTDQPTWTMPAIVGSRIYIRSGDRLACFELQP